MHAKFREGIINGGWSVFMGSVYVPEWMFRYLFSSATMTFVCGNNYRYFTAVNFLSGQIKSNGVEFMGC